MFLTALTSMEAEVVGKRLNRGGGYGLDIPVLYRFYSPPKALLTMVDKKELEKVKKELECNISKCLK